LLSQELGLERMNEAVGRHIVLWAMKIKRA
jgi:hypothetical protein